MPGVHWGLSLFSRRGGLGVLGNTHFAANMGLSAVNGYDVEPPQPGHIGAFRAEAEVLHPQHTRHLLGQRPPLSAGCMVRADLHARLGIHLPRRLRWIDEAIPNVVKTQA
jgi:hypothetical protein